MNPEVILSIFTLRQSAQDQGLLGQFNGAHMDYMEVMGVSYIIRYESRCFAI